MPDDLNFLEFVRSLQLGPRSSANSDGRLALKPVFGQARLGASLVYFDPKDPEAWKTWAQISFPERRQKRRLLRSIAGRIVRDFRLFSGKDAFDVLRTPRRKGLVALLRYQKLIAIDRCGGQVFHILREEFRSERHLLENEMTAHLVLPASTIPLLHAHVDEPPAFLVQAYTRHEVWTWQEWIPQFDPLLRALFAYYEHFGFRSVDTAQYLAGLARACRERLGGLDKPEVQSCTEVLEMLVRCCEDRLKRLGACPTFVTRVHGDFIADHILVPLPVGGMPSFRLTDWSESADYSVFHDLFYFHFQNYGSDFVERILDLQPEDLSKYFGSAAMSLKREFQDRWGHDLSAEYLQLGFLICFVQELEHRLFRLRGEVLDFWARQAGRTLKAGSQSHT